MISLDDIPEMLHEMTAGNLTFEDISSLCLDLFEHHEVETVLAALPERLREDLVVDISATFDNTIPANEFLIFSSGRGDHPAKLIIIDKVRRWLKTRRDSPEAPKR